VKNACIRRATSHRYAARGRRANQPKNLTEQLNGSGEDKLMHSSLIGRRRSITVASAALLASLGFAASAAAIEAVPGAAVSVAGAPIQLAQNTMTPVSYTREQADRGKIRFEKDCVDCHGKDLQGGLNGGAPLRGGKFDQDFGGGPASALFLFMSTQMPPNDPGRFSAEVYADLMAYVLKRNGYQAGMELPSNVDALDNLVLEK
jgi:mono/diheme cytochrome c family protein